MKIILLAFQLWAIAWKRQKVVIHTDSKTVFTDFCRSTLKSSANASFKEILFLIAKWDIVIQNQWISKKSNQLTNALFRFDDEKLTNMCSHWQIFNLKNHSSSFYSSHQNQTSWNVLFDTSSHSRHEKNINSSSNSTRRSVFWRIWQHDQHSTSHWRSE
jgi:hypothetical protein